MALRSVILLLLVTPAIPAQTTFSEAEKKASLAYIATLRDANGAYKVEPNGKPSLRACNGAVKAITNLGGTMSAEDRALMLAFVKSCYDPAKGTFTEPGGKPDVSITSVGVMLALELKMPKDQLAPAMTFLSRQAKTFEEVRIAAAAVESWGPKDCPFDLGPWVKTVNETIEPLMTQKPDAHRDLGRNLGSAAAFYLRLGKDCPQRERVQSILLATQWADGGWGKADARSSDLESCYRTMRALMLLNAKPKQPEKLRSFIARCRNTDGGYGVSPKTSSTMSGTYYASMIAKWVD